MDNLERADRDRQEYGYHFTQLRFLTSPIPPSSQKFAVKQKEGIYIQIPVNLGEFQEKADAEIRALDRALKGLAIWSINLRKGFRGDIKEFYWEGE